MNSDEIIDGSHADYLRQRIATLERKLEEVRLERNTLDDRIQGMERKLASLDWSRISESNMPAGGDETLDVDGLVDAVTESDAAQMTAQEWVGTGFIYRRPINPPSEHPAPETGK
jgi:hypothetical protein